MPAVAAQNVTKIFGQGDSQVMALKDADLSIEAGRDRRAYGAERIGQDDAFARAFADRSADHRTDRD